MVGGTSASEGYVEMYLNGEWGRICSDNMSGDEANVICRQLGYESALLYQPRYLVHLLYVCISYDNKMIGLVFLPK